MVPTITKPLRSRFSGKTADDVISWINIELLPNLQQIRQALNYDSFVRQTTTTAATGVMTTIWTSADVAVGQTVLIDTTIIGIATGACATFKITGTFRNGGTFAQEGATFAAYTQNTPSFTVQYLVVDNHVEVQVQDDGALDVSWEATVTVAGMGP